MDDLYTQSQALLKRSKDVRHEFNSDQGKSQIRLCRQIIALYEILQPLGQASNVAQTWEQWQRQNAQLEIPDKLIRTTHAYVKEADDILYSRPPKGRIRKIVAELANLKTSLPPGIFVRCGYSENSLVKCLIVGAKETPYENGLFEFDIFFPLEYPQKPPHVWFKTTGGGSISFNPNLYPSGKVCLSLLGTWHGEPWVPGQSTLLQVLISIQALIFCDEPMYNDPLVAGECGTAGSVHSIRSNIVVYGHTIRGAMIPWMLHPDGIWAEVITRHFHQNAQVISATTQRWLNILHTNRALRFPGSHTPQAVTSELSDLLKSAEELDYTLQSFVDKRGYVVE